MSTRSYYCGQITGRQSVPTLETRSEALPLLIPTVGMELVLGRARDVGTLFL